jgi:hypothetical protein
MTCLKISFFSYAKWNNVFPNYIYKHLKYLFFSFMRVKIMKIIQCGPCSINGSKLSKNSLFESCYIVIKHLVFVTIIHIIYIST